MPLNQINISNLNNVLSFSVAIIALIVSVIALVYTVRTYLLKSGVNVRGSYSICSSIECEDKYLREITLENLKDKPVIIFKIILKLGHNYFIEIDDFEDTPYILKPFEVFHKEYDPIDMYSTGTSKILLNNLFDDQKVKKQILLSTTEGKYVIKEFIREWDPIGIFFKNYWTVIIQPLRSFYKGRSFGSNAKFVVEFIMEGGRSETIPIYPRDYEIKKFRNFNLTHESIETKESLEEYLLEKIIDKSVICSDVKVYDLESWHKQVYEEETKEVISASYINWFTYYFVCRFKSIYSNYDLKKKNKQRRPRRQRR
jgi:hypothetical protein